jgi:hypothetical protein
MFLHLWVDKWTGFEPVNDQTSPLKAREEVLNKQKKFNQANQMPGVEPVPQLYALSR